MVFGYTQQNDLTCCLESVYMAQHKYNRIEDDL